jgi:hypothetical protein
MTYRQFLVPTEDEILDAIGSYPGATEGDPNVRTFDLASGAGDSVNISYDVPGRSFRVEIRSGDAVRIDLFRESATRLNVTSADQTVRVQVEFQADDLSGVLEIAVGSTVVMHDRLLMI